VGIVADEAARYHDHAYTEPSSAAMCGKEANAMHSAKDGLTANAGAVGTMQQQQTGTPSAAQRHQASVTSSSLDNNNSFFGLREQKSKSSLSLMKRNNSNS